MKDASFSYCRVAFPNRVNGDERTAGLQPGTLVDRRRQRPKSRGDATEKHSIG
jgi:hypothetical protein